MILALCCPIATRRQCSAVLSASDGCFHEIHDLGDACSLLSSTYARIVVARPILPIENVCLWHLGCFLPIMFRKSFFVSLVFLGVFACGSEGCDDPHVMQACKCSNVCGGHPEMTITVESEDCSIGACDGISNCADPAKPDAAPDAGDASSDAGDASSDSTDSG